MRFAVLCLFLAGCAHWTPTREAGIRRVESWRLRSCVTGQCQFEKQCREESILRCRQQGMEDTCGSDSLYTEEPIRCNPFSHGAPARP